MTKYGKITNLLNGKSVLVHATTEHPDSHYGHAVWVDDDGNAWFEVDSPCPFNYRIEVYGIHYCTRIHIGKRIAQLRKAKGVSQRYLAERARVTTANISRIETGRYSAGLDVLSRIADALDADLDIIVR